MGAGSIRDAHTDHEQVILLDLEQAAARHVRCVTDLLAQPELP